LLLFVIVVRACVRLPFADGAAAEAQFAGGVNYLLTELPTEPNSQIFADRTKYLPTELPRSQICRRSDMIAEELPDPNICRRSCRRSRNGRRSQLFAYVAKHLPTEPNSCQLSCREARFAVVAK
jgi:hypothetical protein